MLRNDIAIVITMFISIIATMKISKKIYRFIIEKALNKGIVKNLQMIFITMEFTIIASLHYRRYTPWIWLLAIPIVMEITVLVLYILNEKHQYIKICKRKFKIIEIIACILAYIIIIELFRRGALELSLATIIFLPFFY